MYVTLLGYVQYQEVNVTSDELARLNLSDVKDTAGQAVVDKTLSRFFVTIRRVTDVKTTYVGSGYDNEQLGGVQKAFEKMMDTLLPTLNLQDTVFINFELYKNNRKPISTDEEFFFYSFRDYRIEQQFVISSQAVVDLKRTPFGAGMVAYPSPATDEVSVKFEVKEPIEGRLILSNSLGQVIQEVDHKNLMKPYRFDIKDQKPGAYFVRALIDGEYFTQKIIKE